MTQWWPSAPSLGKLTHLFLKKTVEVVNLCNNQMPELGGIMCRANHQNMLIAFILICIVYCCQILTVIFNLFLEISLA